MSFEITDQVKYRLTGGVILMVSVCLFMPMLMKKSNQRFEENLSLSLQVPPKPQKPELTIPTAQQVFNKVKPTQVIKTQPQVAERPVTIQISKARRLESVIPTVPMEMATPIIQPLPEKSGIYGVQLASFSHPENADFLVKRLRKLGYEAQSSTLELKTGKIYKVVVGQLKNKKQAIQLQKQLAENTQLNGMIIVQG